MIETTKNEHSQNNETATVTKMATLGGGCFWCLEAVFQRVKGVTSVESGYAGGHLPNPSYAAVCQGRTGHAEVVRIEFDPRQVDFRQLLEGFFCIHDPTTLNRQGADVGDQYRSVIFYHDAEQAAIAHAVMKVIAPQFDAPLVTQVLPLPIYYPAEAEHQDYFRLHPEQGYCRSVIAPKLQKFRQQFAERLLP